MTVRALGRAAVTAAILAAPLPAVACQWTVPSDFWSGQSNGFAVEFRLQQNGTHLVGSASYAQFYQRQFPKGQGSADGSINGNFFQVTAYWAANSAGVYEGTINGQGRIDGVTYDKRNPASRASWNSDILLTCQ